MKLLAVTTESHRRLYEDFFIPSLPRDMELLTHTMAIQGDGSYNSITWQEGVVQKLRFALDYIRENAGKVYVLSDVDIRFTDDFETKKLLALLESSDCDILFPSETANGLSGEVNTGFYIARCTQYVESLMMEAISTCSGHEVANDQIAINHLLNHSQRGSKWDLLPPYYYARTHGFPPPPQIRIHHANLTSTVEEKALQLEKVRSYLSGGKISKGLIILKEAMEYMSSGKLAGMLLRRLRKLLG